MSKWPFAIAIIVVLFAAAQFVRPGEVNLPTTASQTIEAKLGKTNALVRVLHRACDDCHSNRTAWPSYAQIAPLSWMMAYSVKEARKAVNFSEWSAYSSEQQQGLLAASCADASNGKMPGGLWTSIKRQARLSPGDVATICAAAR